MFHSLTPWQRAAIIAAMPALWSAGPRDPRVCSADSNRCRNIQVLKNLIIATKLFAFVNLLFLPSITVLLVVAFTVGDRWWFFSIGIPALIANAVILISASGRAWTWTQVTRVAGQTASVSQSCNFTPPLNKG